MKITKFKHDIDSWAFAVTEEKELAIGIDINYDALRLFTTDQQFIDVMDAINKLLGEMNRQYASKLFMNQAEVLYVTKEIETQIKPTKHKTMYWGSTYRNNYFTFDLHNINAEEKTHQGTWELTLVEITVSSKYANSITIGIITDLINSILQTK